MKRVVRDRRAFVLLAVLSLLAVIVVLVVSLATLTRVERGTVAYGQTAKQVRHDALVALHLALGRLQEAAGPDDRLTGTAESVGGAESSRFFTGVWNAADPAEGAITWLVSGNETDPLSITPGTSTDAFVEILGAGTTGRGRQVAVPLIELASEPVPGAVEPTPIARYAWWVEDLGVKASLALGDRSDEVAYADWQDVSQRQRLRQQVAFTPTWIASDGSGFEPFSADNHSRLLRVLQADQLPLLEAVGTPPLAQSLQDQHHDFTARTSAVLSSTVPAASGGRGLLVDLALAPEALGPVFAAYAARHYVETPAPGNTAIPEIAQPSSARRRVYLQPPVTQPATSDHPAMAFSIAPVLTEALLQFRVDRIGGQVEVRSRLYVALWNPYTAALVPPEDLNLEVHGLPTITILDPVEGSAVDVDLNEAPFGEWGRRVALPFVAGATAQTDRVSWLPGRMYGWVTGAGASPPPELAFYSKTLTATGWRVATVPLAGTSSNLSVEAPAITTLRVQLQLGETVLVTAQLPPFPAVQIGDVEPPGQGPTWNWRFAYGGRLNQPTTTSVDRSWLLTAGRDPRAAAMPASAFDPFHPAAGFNPAATPYYVGDPPTATGLDHHLLFRVQGTALRTRSANYDVPVFELPRLPLLSLGELQHVQVTGSRPFALGNSWGGEANAAFDRFFFSGLSATGAGPDLAVSERLPNWNLRTVDSRADPSGTLEVAVLRGLEAQGGARSSRFLLQDGAFNVNSVRAAAWQAVLSGARFPDTWQFEAADIDNGPLITEATGSQRSAFAVTGWPLRDAAWGPGGRAGPSFWRFPQSAQETYFWSVTPALTSAEMSRRPFRQGVRGGDESPLSRLTSEQVRALAEIVASLVAAKHAESGPFASLQDFLGPHAIFGGASLLERAIEDAGINHVSLRPRTEVDDEFHPGFSSLTLTQGDLLTLLAPYLRCRSDTFAIRAYAEALNPLTGRVVARAWCEAVVQRFPMPVDPADSIDQPTGRFGRRFEIVSFRWLRPVDL